ncbi:MAG TPA: phosphatase domain-containing protein [Flavitalea sp.]|nr:phosphatase domain-containing protein [Flavitalea sp.]
MISTGNVSVTKHSFTGRVKAKLLFLFRLTNNPVVKVYDGYGNHQSAIVFGHVFTLSPLSRKKYRKNFITNFFALLRLFMVKPEPRASLRMIWDNQPIEIDTESDGFFKFEFKPGTTIQPGWHKITIELLRLKGKTVSNVRGEGSFFIPDENQFACISDIDDTFLISHSSNLRKRLYVLFTENAHSRKPFEGVVNHYQLLSRAGHVGELTNPFFYVSSSEWNLYEYITEFSRQNGLPRGVYLLNQAKTFSKIFKTGQNNHATKFMRIARIIESYPEHRYILLGDDSQMDPVIYSSIVEHFPGKIRSIYLRRVDAANREKVEGIVKNIRDKGIDCCYFSHSEEAIKHSKESGLVSAMET